jgi:CBS domain-containing protein
MGNTYLRKEESPMKVRELMTSPAIRISQDETVEVAARTLTHYNIGALPVCGSDGRVCGVVTDRDLVTRCMASGRPAGQMKVRDVMTGTVVSVQPDMDAETVAHLMGQQQVRRLPVMENGKLCGMVSLGDLANREDSCMGAADALADICSNISAR